MHMSPLRRIPLSQFLVHSRQLLKASIEAKKPLSLVTGNESADLDSFASSLLYAYLSSPGPTQSQQSTILPILPIPRADLNLRPEFIYLLSELRIPKQDLIFIDDIPTPILTGAGGSASAKNEVVLVDHNTLQEKIFPPTKTVVKGVIDHHKDEGKYLDAGPRIIEVSGSCVSLVTNWGKSKWGDWGNGPGVKEAAKLALAAILIDTGNMKMRVTPHDRSAVDFLESKLGGGGVGIIGDDEGDASVKEPWNSTNFFLKLSEAKSSLDSLNRVTPTLILGISSVVKPLSYLTSPCRGGPEAFLSALSKFAQERNLDVAAVMPSFTDKATGEFSRELLVWEISEEFEYAF
ncbi:DHH phosphoesterase [Terfezia boudieri ATCC MYA-4762]|uniref:DHH phosphoesterase n=1 Tax=Terfezia boudieri ATCC MYA-4762 TaxID=1051890 RepID=A0A3N4LZH2_9PEZI|nr:DHH phosphoesterase [Terfezia boudieri ATCC MYA-4762]